MFAYGWRIARWPSSGGVVQWTTATFGNYGRRHIRAYMSSQGVYTGVFAFDVKRSALRCKTGEDGRVMENQSAGNLTPLPVIARFQ